MAYKEKPFPTEAQLLPKYSTVKKYLDEYAEEVKDYIHLGTQVVDVKSSDSGANSWAVTTKNLRTGSSKTDTYDAVVVASGHFDVPYTPDIPGIKLWNETYPGIISHSKFFDSPEPFHGKKVIVVGSSASGLDIGSQISKAAVFARVWSGRLTLPDTAEMKAWEHATAIQRGNGTAFHALHFPLDADYMNFFYEWAAKAEPRHELINSGNDKHRKEKWKSKHLTIPREEEDGDNDESLAEDEWPIDSILAETESQYLIDWEGPWTPSWEPKEHANDAAIQAWEEKKKNEHSQQGSQLPEISETQTLHLTSQGNTDSGWFEAPESGQVTPYTAPTPLGSGFTTSISSAVRSPETTGVFEYNPNTSIPLEYLLPSEVQGYLATQRTNSSTSTSTTASESPKSGTETARGIQRSKSTASSIIQASSVAPTNPLIGEGNGVAETPPLAFAIFETQGPPQYPVSKPSSSQNTLGSGSYRSGYSSLVSQLFLSRNRSSIGCVSSTVPESTTGSSQVSTNRSIPNFSQGSLSARHSYLTPELPTEIMEDHDQKKEVASLAETMEKYSQYEGATPREKMRNAYLQLNARAISLQAADTSATPSSMGDIEPSAPVSVPEITAPLSVRVDKEPTVHHSEPKPHPIISEPPEETPQQQSLQTIQPSALTVSHTEEVLPGSVHLSASEYAVPLPMDSRVKDDYERVLKNETQSIREFLRGSIPSDMLPGQEERLVSKMREVLRNLSNVATHPDLNIAEHIKDSVSDLRKEAAWAEYSSAKFLFLGYLVEIASSRDIHFVIMLQGEKTQKVVERYLMGKGLVYTRPREEMGPGTNSEVSLVKGPLSFGIQSTHSEGVMETYKTPSAVIALDSSLNVKSPSVEHLRTTFARNGSLLPVIRLIVSNSSEHIELCFSDPPELQRLQLIIRYTVRLRDIVGDLQDDALGVREDVEEVLSWIFSDHFGSHWPLTTIEPLHVVSSNELLSAQLEVPAQTDAGGTPIPNTQVQKRLFVEDSGDHSSKRPRMEITQDNTQLTESTKFPSQALDSGLLALEQNLVHMRNAHAAELEKFKKDLDDMQSRLQDREKLLETLQHRYETRTKDLHHIRRERDRLAESKATAEQKTEKQKEENSKLKDERTQLRHELEQAREEIRSQGGSVAELEAAREEIRRLTKVNASLERKSEYEAKQAEYTREQYQTASNVAAQSGNEVRQLREENETLKRKVDGNATRLREINLKNDEARHLSRISELEATLAAREDLLRRKEDELREIRKNRPSTRSTSTQPRSPRLTAGSRPTSPGINNHNGRGSGLRFSSEMSV
ncbi:hypothetical protein BBP40_000983 [Aspergillus hancockii]|nr:hypothetical protein BBP40_000983 [Aspergillus hancockii]